MVSCRTKDNDGPDLPSRSIPLDMYPSIAPKLYPGWAVTGRITEECG